ncbi:MAG: HAMP domain-containing sensor histidine kinase [Planctomycetota bacterium]
MLSAAGSKGAHSAFGALTSRFGRRMVLLFATCAMLPLLVFAAVAVTRVSGQLREEVQANLHKDAKMAGQGIASRLTSVAGDLSLAAELVQRWRSEGVWSDGEALQRQVGARCRSIRLVDGGRVRALCGDAEGPLPELGERQLRHLATGAPLLSVAGGGAGGAELLQMSLAVDPADPASLWVTALIAPQFLWNPSELRGPSCDLFVFDVKHRLLFHSSQEVPPVADFVRVAAEQGAAGGFEWAVDGQRHVARYWRAFLLPQYGEDLLMVQSRPEQQAFAAERSFVVNFAMIALGTLLVVVLASLIQIRRTLVPVMDLRAATERVAAGDLDTRVAIDSDDEFGSLGATFNDMTQALQENIQHRERTERDLVASRDAALAAVRAKAEFVTNVSHEFRTPMAEILGAAEILTTLGDEDADAREEFSGIALHGAQRLSKLLDDVLEFEATPEAGGDPQDVCESLHRAVAALEPAVGERVQIDCAPGLPRVVADGEGLDRVWGRLLDNAVKFSAEGTPIAVRSFAIDNQVVVEVVDQGVGVAEEDLERMFEPFQQVGRDQLTDKASGSGLGLTLVRCAVEAFGGTVVARSKVGVGTTFQVRLPGVAVGAAAVASAT